MSAVLLILLVAGGAWIYWRFDVRQHPYRPCSRCHGKRTSAGSSSQAWGLYRKCGGRGSQRRFGAPEELLNRAPG